MNDRSPLAATASRTLRPRHRSSCTMASACFCWSCKDKKQQEEGQEAAEGRTGSSRRKDKRQQEEGQEASG